MKNLLIAIIILFTFNPLFSQKDTSQFYNKTLSNNNFSIELGGKAFAYSIGYERTIYKSKKLLLSGCVNLSYEPFAFKGIVVPIGINVLIGEKRNKLSFGLYATNILNFNPYPKTYKERMDYKAAGAQYDPLYELMPALSLGYRRYFNQGNSITIAITPLLFLSEFGNNDLLNPDIVPWIGLNYNIKF
jgi:hypothetical protein